MSQMAIRLNNGSTVICEPDDILLALMQMIPSERVGDFARLVEPCREERLRRIVTPNGARFIPFEERGGSRGN